MRSPIWIWLPKKYPAWMTALPPPSDVPGPTAPWWERRAAWLWESIVEGHLADHGPGEEVWYAVEVSAVGRLGIPEGRLVAADPYVMDSAPVPFDQRLPVAEADVLVARATTDAGDKRVVALILRCGSSPISTWAMATCAEQDLATLEPEGFFGYPVDAGTGALGGVDAMAVANRVLTEDAGMLEDPISTALFADGNGTDAAVCVAPEEGAEPIAVCSSGWGDGSYPTWLGLDATGTVVVALTDFLLTTDPYAAPPAPPDEAPLPDAAQSRRDAGSNPGSPGPSLTGAASLSWGMTAIRRHRIPSL